MKTSLENLSTRSCLVILDGYGINPNTNKNAIKDAQTPQLDSLFKSYPFTTLDAGGVSVGLPKGVCGNSEVGHMNLGAGRPVRQDLVRINESIEEKKLHTREHFVELVKKSKSTGNRVHLMGLLSDGGVHSHLDHIVEVANHLIAEKLDVFFHAFLDGRDTPPKSAKPYIEKLLSLEGLTFASMQGRSIGMDRDRRWEKTKACYDMFTGKGLTKSIDPLSYLEKQYQSKITDEFIEPILFDEHFKMQKEDSVFFLNFRPDRAIQISLAMNDPEFSHFQRDWMPGHFLCMTPYIAEEVELPILFDKEKIEGTFSDYLSKLGHHQYKIAETEKYAHITFFFNGGRKDPFPGEIQTLVPSPKEVATYDQKPEMSALQVTDKLLSALDEEQYKFYLVNYANSDMVGHTGKYEAAVKAIETLDDCVGRLAAKCLENNITMIITADHGNSDQMVYDNGDPHTSHTNAPVPFVVIHPDLKGSSLTTNGKDPALKDVVPTLVKIMGLPASENFTGESVFK